MQSEPWESEEFCGCDSCVRMNREDAYYEEFRIEMAELGRDREADWDAEREFENWLFNREMRFKS